MELITELLTDHGSERPEYKKEHPDIPCATVGEQNVVWKVSSHHTSVSCRYFMCLQECCVDMLMSVFLVRGGWAYTHEWVFLIKTDRCALEFWGLGGSQRGSSFEEGTGVTPGKASRSCGRKRGKKRLLLLQPQILSICQTHPGDSVAWWGPQEAPYCFPSKISL